MTFLKIVLTLLTFLTVLFCAGLGVLGLVSHWPFMASVVCFMLAAGFGYFSFNDAKYWLAYFQGKLPNANPTNKV